MTLTQGTVIGNYVIGDHLGSGGMGMVYRAHDTQHNRQVALKVLAPELRTNRAAIARFTREAKAIAKLAHPNIVGFYNFGESAGVPFVAMELLHGESLRTRLSKAAKLEWRKALTLGHDIATGLAAAHAAGIIHRDLKPENIYLCANDTVKILDFGLAQIREAHSRSSNEAELYAPTLQAVTQVGTLLGTPGYMAPEQINGLEATVAADVFAFGCLLYEMLAGKPLFLQASPAESLAATLRDNPARLPRGTAINPLPEQINALLAVCLAKDPDARHLSAQAVAHEIQNILRLSPFKIRLATLRHQLAALRPMLYASVVLLCLSAGGWLGYQQWRKQATQAQPPKPHAIPSEALDNYFLGLKLLEDRNNEEQIILSIPHFQKALQIAPDYALAKVGLARAYILQSEPAQLKLAEQQALDALKIDANLAGAHTALGVVQMLQHWQFQAAEQSFERALKTSSGDAYTYHWSAELFAVRLKHDQSIDAIKRAESLDPSSESIRRDVARHYYFAHQYAKAFQQYELALAKNPQDFQARCGLARIRAHQGQSQAAIADLLALLKIKKFSTEPSLHADLSFCYALAGQTTNAKRELNQFLQLTHDPFPDNFYAIGAFDLIGERDQAFACLENAYQKHSPSILYLQTHPALDRLRDDPRFHKLLKEIGFTP